MRRWWVFVLSGLVLVATMAGASAAVGATDHNRQSPVSVQAPAADTPSPTLGSTPQPGVNPPGDADADPSDFDQVPLAVGSFLFLGALVGGSILFYLWRRSRQNTGSTD